MLPVKPGSDHQRYQASPYPSYTSTAQYVHWQEDDLQPRMEEAAKVTPLTPPSPFLSSQARWDTTPDEWETFREYRSVLNPHLTNGSRRMSHSKQRKEKQRSVHGLQQSLGTQEATYRARASERVHRAREPSCGSPSGPYKSGSLSYVSNTKRWYSSVMPQLTSQSIASLSPTKASPYRALTQRYPSSR
jgi:hypothetical protein